MGSYTEKGGGKFIFILIVLLYLKLTEIIDEKLIMIFFIIVIVFVCFFFIKKNMLKKDKLIEDVENIYFKEFYIQRNKNNHILFYQSFGELRSKKITQEEFEKAKNGEIDLSYFKKKYCLL